MKALIILSLFISSVCHSDVLRIAVLDTGLDLKDLRFKNYLCSSGHKDFTGEGIRDTHGHGTHVVSTIIKEAGDAPFCLVIVKYFHRDRKNNNSLSFFQSLRWASSLNVDVINYSGSGPDYSQKEYDVIKYHPNVRYFVAAGNDDVNLDNIETRKYPACYYLPNIVVVGCRYKEEEFIHYCGHTNYGNSVDVWENGHNVIGAAIKPGTSISLSGTSMSTAMYTGKYIYKHFSLHSE